MTEQLISLSEQSPYLVRALHALGQRGDQADDAEELAQDLSSITAVVAKKFTNDRTAEGLLEAVRLTIGCVSLGLAHRQPHDDPQAALDFLIEYGAERAFQQGFRLIKELSELPEVAMLTAYDKAPQEQERQLKTTFLKFCAADPNGYWTGDKKFQREFENRSGILSLINCAKWLRKNHWDGAIREADLDADGVVSIALIFATQGGGKILAKAGQKDLENLLANLRKNQPDFEQSWADFLQKIPAEYQHLVNERIVYLRDSSIIKMMHALSAKSKPNKAQLTALFQELQNHGGNEIEVDYA
jgi:hypothetical protein